MKITNSVISIILCLAVTPAELLAHAYECDKVLFASRKPVLWKNTPITFRVENSIWNDPTRKAALDEAVEYWNKAAENSFVINIFQENGSSMQANNNVNEIYMAPPSEFDPGVLATAPIRWSDPNEISGHCYMKEADIKFNTDFIWDNVPEWGDFSGPVNFGLVAVHEIGHTLAQKHLNTHLATMNESYPAGGQIGSNYESRPHAPELALHRSLYGIGSQTVDVAASAWTIVPPPGQTFTGSAYTLDLIRDDYSTLTNGSVSRGENVFFRYSIENLGTTTKDLEVKMYMSNDSIIGDSGDIYLGMSYYTLPGGTNLTGEKYLQIPTTRTGFQYFGYKVTQATGEPSSVLDNNWIRLYRTYWVN